MSFLPNKLLLNFLACGLILSSPLSIIAATATTTPPSTNHQTEHDWKKFTSTESGFSIDFPGKPEHIEQSIEIPKTDLTITYETYLSEPSENIVYVVSVWNYPSQIDMSKPEVNLQDGFGGMLSALPGSEVLNMRMTEVDKYKALEFLVKNEDIFFQGKLILVHNTLYQVFTVYKTTEDMTDNYIHFVDSFKLVSPEKRDTSAPSKNGTDQKDQKKKMNV
ncbi:MAG: hypothetical protein S4CHLAM123_07180 [Chlamydiales bacterium]|nr:hypothetical protein [Chlamydiales bacterium]